MTKKAWMRLAVTLMVIALILVGIAIGGWSVWAFFPRTVEKEISVEVTKEVPVEVTKVVRVVVTATSTSTPVLPTPTPVAPTPTLVPPTPTPAPVALASANTDFKWGWNTEWYRSPFRETTDLLSNPLTHETLAEPGVFPGMGDTQTTWDIMQDEETYMLVPEAGYHYFATGSYCFWWVNPEASDEQGKEVRVPLGCAPAGEERIYLTVVRGYPSDGGDADLNQRVVVSDYVRATGIHHHMAAGAYVSLGWMLQQVDNAFEPQPGIEDPNCGDNGCDYPYVVVIDLLTQTTRAWLVGPGLRDWTRVQDL